MDLVTLALAKKYTDKKASGGSAADISAHNTSTSAHTDIRNLINALTTRLNALADSDDTTLDQMSEVVEYIKNNKSLIDGITTSKVNVADIVNGLTSNASNKPLSAAQGVVLKGLIDTLTNSKVSTSELTTAVNTALADAKASGDFKGDKGDKGEKGDKGDTGATGATGAVGAKGADGKAGTNGASVTAIAFTKDAEGNITGGTATLSDNSTITITVTEAASE